MLKSHNKQQNLQTENYITITYEMKKLNPHIYHVMAVFELKKISSYQISFKKGLH